MHLKALLIILISCVAAVSAIGQSQTDAAKKFYEMTKAAPKTFNDGEYEKARSLSEALLSEAESWRTDWNYGNAVHVAHLVLGRIELSSGDKNKARMHLLEAGRTPGSPQLNTFGPDMLFAKEMLKAGERETVLEYLQLTGKFWKKRESQLSDWKATIEKGEIPNFGANVRYYF